MIDASYHVDVKLNFWSKIQDFGSGCWTPKHNREYYTQVRVDGKRYPSHRFAWIITYGDIPDDIFVLHHCDNKPCVRPSHLFLGTTEDNLRDLSNKDLSPKPNAKLTPQDIQEIFELAKQVSNRHIAKQFKVSHTTINNLLRGYHYA